jgi:uncharacterized Zn finger protein
LVAVESRDLSHPYDFLRIAEIYKRDGQSDRALAWAERGWRAYPAYTRRDGRLREFLADAYHDCGRHHDAMELTWQAFVDCPDFELYQSLKRHADRFRVWQDWRDKALAYIRENVAATCRPRTERSSTPFPRDHSVLVEIFIWERNVEDAWREAKGGGCSAGLWLKLAEKREESHPHDALAVYRKHIARVLTQADSRGYDEAVCFIGKMRKLMMDTGASTAFARDVAELRALNRRKRNFIKLLDQKKWSR